MPTGSLARHACPPPRRPTVDNSVEFVVLHGVQPLAGMLGAKVPEECSMALDMALRLFDLRGDLTSVAGVCSVFAAASDATCGRFWPLHCSVPDPQRRILTST